jgi:hypothetical protein
MQVEALYASMEKDVYGITLLSALKEKYRAGLGHFFG